MRRLRPGKIPVEVLEQSVLKMTGAPSRAVATPANVGLDFAAIKVGRGFMIVSADPITGVSERIGEYALNVSANDVATSGNRPQFAEAVLLLQEGAGKEDVGRIAEQIHHAAKRLGIAVVGGHTEVTRGLPRPIVAVTVLAYAMKYVTSGDAKEGDTIMMTKTAGLEGTAVLAGRKGLFGGRMSEVALDRARKFLTRISVVEEALAAYGTGYVHAMHDCTEGGVLGAVYEMSLASGLGFHLNGGAVPVAPETQRVCKLLSLDPLKLIGSGSILLSVKRGQEARVKRALRSLSPATSIGEFTGDGRTMTRTDGRVQSVRTAPEDELWRALGRIE